MGNIGHWKIIDTIDSTINIVNTIYENCFIGIISVSPPTKGDSGNPGRQQVYVQISGAMPNGISGTIKILQVLNFVREF